MIMKAVQWGLLIPLEIMFHSKRRRRKHQACKATDVNPGINYNVYPF